jgi:hypothetical protein
MEYATQQDIIKFAKRFSKTNTEVVPIKERKRSTHPESDLQKACVKWFDHQYNSISLLLFHCANGGKRNEREAERFKKEGVRPGVADLILLISKNGYSSLCIELKAGKGKQSDNQKIWQQIAEKHGNLYIVCNSLDSFMKIINDYLKCKNT